MGTLETKSRGQKRRERDAKEIAAFDALPNLQKIKRKIMWINGTTFGDKHSITTQMIDELFCDIELKSSNDFVKQVIATVRRTYRASEKQAYVIARAADEAGIMY